MAADRSAILEGLGRRLASAWKDCRQIGDIAGCELPRNRVEAYFVQDAMARHIGQPVSGWKVGATSARMRELDGHDDVIPGRIFREVTWEGEATRLPASRFPGARAETEFAFRISADLPVRETPWTAEELAPISTLHPAIEIIGNRHELNDAPDAVRSLMTIADNGGGIGFVFGRAVSDWSSVDFGNHMISLSVDGGPPADNFLGDMRCVPIVALAELANHLGRRGIGLTAGDFISTGATTVPQQVWEGSHVCADFGMLGSIDVWFE